MEQKFYGLRPETNKWKSLLREDIKYSASAAAVTRGNPILKNGDLINIKNNIYSRSTYKINE